MTLIDLEQALTKTSHEAFIPMRDMPGNYLDINYCQDKAAVLILFVDTPGVGLSILFTKRSKMVETHKGQVCFPGGHFEPQDDSLIHTACRECEEEVGILAGTLQVYGMLPLKKTRFQQEVLSVIASTQGPVLTRAQEDEVVAIFEVPVAYLLDKKNYYFKSITHKGKTYHMPYIDYGTYVIWGFTAAVLWSFITCLAQKPISN